jgi:hypothetical protein
MRYLNNSELSQFHDSLLEMFKKQATNVSEETWGFPSGFIDCDTFQFITNLGNLYIGHNDNEEANRWWIPVASEDLNFGTEFHIAFEMSIPKTQNRSLSVHYMIDDNKMVHIMHKGKFTVGYGSVSMAEFFEYYQDNPGRWQVISFIDYDYLELAKLNLQVTDKDFNELVESLAQFAAYIPAFKNQYRI